MKPEKYTCPHAGFQVPPAQGRVPYASPRARFRRLPHGLWTRQKQTQCAGVSG